MAHNIATRVAAAAASPASTPRRAPAPIVHDPLILSPHAVPALLPNLPALPPVALPSEGAQGGIDIDDILNGLSGGGPDRASGPDLSFDRSSGDALAASLAESSLGGGLMSETASTRSSVRASSLFAAAAQHIHLVRGQSSRIKLIKNRYETGSTGEAAVASRRGEIKSILTLQDSALTSKNVHVFETEVAQMRSASNRQARPMPAGDRRGADAPGPLASPLPTDLAVEMAVPTDAGESLAPSGSTQSLAQSHRQQGRSAATDASQPLASAGDITVPPRVSIPAAAPSSAGPASHGAVGSTGNLSASHNLPYFHLKRLTSGGNALSSSMGALATLRRDSPTSARTPRGHAATAEAGPPGSAHNLYGDDAGFGQSGSWFGLSASGPAGSLASLGASLSGKRDFRLWYENFLHEVDANPGAVERRAGAPPFRFGQVVRLEDVFGTRGSSGASGREADRDAADVMCDAAAAYDALKGDPEFTQTSANNPPSPVVATAPSLSPSSTDAEPPVRTLDIFRDANLDGIELQVVDEETGIEIPAAGPLHKLLDALIFPTSQSDMYTEVFLATYRFFTTGATVLDALRAWFNVALAPNATRAEKDFYNSIRRAIQTRVTRIVLLWIKNHWHNFHTSKELLADLTAFAKGMEETAYSDASKIAAAMRESRLQWYSTQYLSLSGQNNAALLRRLAPGAKATEPLILALSEEQFACQVTLIEHFHLAQLRADAYLHLMTNPAPVQGGSTNVVLKVVLEYAHWHRAFARHVSSVVLQQESPKKQAKAIKNFLRVANTCYEQFRNYATVFAIVYGLKRAAVAHLAAAWELVPMKYLVAFSRYDVLASRANSYQAYWADLRTKAAPLIPYFAAHVHDMLVIDTEMGTFVSPDGTSASGDSVVNFAKFTDLDSLICELELYRTASYKDVIPDSTSSDYMSAVYGHVEMWPTVEDELLDRIPTSASPLSAV